VGSGRNGLEGGIIFSFGTFAIDQKHPKALKI